MVAALAFVAASCAGPTVVSLSYPHGTYVHKLAPVRVGVYYLDDERPGWPATAAMRMFDGSHGKNLAMRHAEGEKDKNVFVAECLRAELAAAGMNVSGSTEFNRPNADATADGARATGIDRVLTGRINYFGFVSPVPGPEYPPVVVGGAIGGIVGGIIAAKLSTRGQVESAAYVDIDLWVVQPSTRKILWAGTARSKRKTADLSGALEDRVAVLLPETLYSALKEVIPRSDFLAAMGATLLRTRSPTQASQAHEQNAQRLFQSERFADAAVEFEKAHQASGDPAHLFNAALCYRRSGDAKMANVAFKEYLRNAPKVPHRPTVEERIEDLNR